MSTPNLDSLIRDMTLDGMLAGLRRARRLYLEWVEQTRTRIITPDATIPNESADRFLKILDANMEAIENALRSS